VQDQVREPQFGILEFISIDQEPQVIDQIAGIVAVACHQAAQVHRSLRPIPRGCIKLSEDESRLGSHFGRLRLILDQESLENSNRFMARRPISHPRQEHSFQTLVGSRPGEPGQVFVDEQQGLFDTCRIRSDLLWLGQCHSQVSSAPDPIVVVDAIFFGQDLLQERLGLLRSSVSQVEFCQTFNEW
jgi:hypothetical protein